MAVTADVIAHAFEVLKVELKSEVAKELFLYYQATQVIIHYLKPVNKVSFCNSLVLFIGEMLIICFLNCCLNFWFSQKVFLEIGYPSSAYSMGYVLSICCDLNLNQNK